MLSRLGLSLPRYFLRRVFVVLPDLSFCMVRYVFIRVSSTIVTAYSSLLAPMGRSACLGCDALSMPSPGETILFMRLYVVCIYMLIVAPTLGLLYIIAPSPYSSPSSPLGTPRCFGFHYPELLTTPNPGWVDLFLIVPPPLHLGWIKNH